MHTSHSKVQIFQQNYAMTISNLGWHFLIKSFGWKEYWKQGKNWKILLFFCINEAFTPFSYADPSLLRNLCTVCATEKCRKPVSFKYYMENKALINHNITALQATDVEHCRALCFIDHRCISITYDIKNHLCNLSDSDHVLHPEHMVNTTNTEYWSIEVLNVLYYHVCSHAPGRSFLPCSFSRDERVLSAGITIMHVLRITEFLFLTNNWRGSTEKAPELW